MYVKDGLLYISNIYIRELKSYLSNTYSSLFKIKQIIHRRSNSIPSHLCQKCFPYIFRPDSRIFGMSIIFTHTIYLYIQLQQ